MGLQLQHGHTHGMGLGGHGHSHSHSHSHGGEKAKKKKTIRKAAQVTTPVVPDPNSLSITPKGDGNGDSSTDLNLPATESQSYSYQNSTHINTPPNPPPTNESTSKSRKKANHNPEDVVNMNVRAAFIHVIGDVVQSIGVFIAALIIYFRPDWALADPICTFIFSIIVLITTFSILKDAILVLMEGTPGYMRYTEVMESFKQIDGVERVHNLRIWALSVNKVALAAHLVIREHYDPKKILEEANSLVHQQYNFFETTIQIEEYSSSMENCSQCEVPPS